MTTKQAKLIVKRKAAEVYSCIYDKMFKKAVRRAFYDGMVFWDMVKSGAITEDMINEDFFKILSESHHQEL